MKTTKKNSAKSISRTNLKKFVAADNIYSKNMGWIHLEMRAKKVYSINFQKGRVENRDDLDLKKLKASLIQYCDTGLRRFNSVSIDWGRYTLFEKKILKALYRRKTGRLLSYKELAVKGGVPKAARAVGRVMSKNRTPILIPCHYVVRSDGDLGGFSSGILKKKKLLKVENLL
ncbi:MGMT family protein [PVC group bacterium]|nr:MGMT family protein [PVC group bacterium]